MGLSSMSPPVIAICLILLTTIVSSHTVITYPGWRGDNLHMNGSIPDASGLGVGENNTYPYGMQWMYPCTNSYVSPCLTISLRYIAYNDTGGGMPMSSNRTKWPVTGGAVGFQPGWFQGHSSALLYINLGDGNIPGNYSLVMQPMFGITGPDNVAYNGSVCLPQVPLPANYTATIGSNATIQVIEAAQHGAALYNVSENYSFQLRDREELSRLLTTNVSVCGHHFRRSRRST